MSDIFDNDTQQLLEQFPEAKLTMRDRLPTGMILTSAILTIQKSILNIQYSEEELREAIMGFVAMIPDELKDPAFNEELEKSRIRIAIDIRPSFCEVKASDEYCKKHNIATVEYIESFEYIKVFHACFNLLMRRNMLLKTEAKEIFTGKKARKEEEEFTEDEPISEPGQSET